MADELALVAGAGITDESVDAVTQARNADTAPGRRDRRGRRNARDIDPTAGMSVPEEARLVAGQR